MSILDFIRRVAANYGNPNAVFLPPDKRLEAGQAVKIFLAVSLADGKATGYKNKKGEHDIIIKHRGRRKMITARNSQILINW